MTTWNYYSRSEDEEGCELPQFISGRRDVGHLRRAGTGGSPPECPGRSLCEDAQANLSASPQEMGPAAAAAIEGGHAEMRYKEDEEGRAEMRTRLPAVLMAPIEDAGVHEGEGAGRP